MDTKDEKKPYVAPEVKEEIDLETRAGSCQPDPLDPTNRPPC